MRRKEDIERPEPHWTNIFMTHLQCKSRAHKSHNLFCYKENKSSNNSNLVKRTNDAFRPTSLNTYLYAYPNHHLLDCPLCQTSIRSYHWQSTSGYSTSSVQRMSRCNKALHTMEGYQNVPVGTNPKAQPCTC